MTEIRLSKAQLDLLSKMTARGLNGWHLFPDWFIETEPRPGFRRLLRPEIPEPCLADLRRLHALENCRIAEGRTSTGFAALVNLIVCNHLFPECWDGDRGRIHAQWKEAAERAGLDRFDLRMLEPYGVSPAGIFCRRAFTTDIMRLVNGDEPADGFIAWQRAELEKPTGSAPRMI